MFWQHDLIEPSQIEPILKKEVISLDELLDQDDLLQECKSENVELINYFLSSDVLQQLIAYSVSEPTQVHYKYPNIASDVLSADVPSIYNALVADDLLMALWSFLDGPPPLNPLLASYFSKIVASLFTHKPSEMFGFINRQENSLLDKLIIHINTSAIMDLLLHFVVPTESPESLVILQWMCQENLPGKLYNRFGPSYDDDIYSNTGMLLCEIVCISCASQVLTKSNNPLLAEICSPVNVKLLLSYMFSSQKNNEILISGTEVLLALLNADRPRIYTSSSMTNLTVIDSTVPMNPLADGLVLALRPHLSGFVRLLTEPESDGLRTSAGVLDPPVGMLRLKIIELFIVFIQTNTPTLNEDILHLNVLGICLGLFFRYTWNNFLHTAVTDLVRAIIDITTGTNKSTSAKTDDESSLVTKSSSAMSADALAANVVMESDDDTSKMNNTEGDTTSSELNGITGENNDEHTLFTSLFVDCDICSRITDAIEDNASSTDSCRLRLGSMGHITILSNIIVKVFQDKSKHDLGVLKRILPIVKESWFNYVGVALVETNRIDAKNLGGPRPALSKQDSDEDDFNNDAEAQEAFRQYLSEPLTTDLPDADDFRFDEDEDDAEMMHEFGNDWTFDRKELFNTDSKNINSVLFETENDPEIDDSCDGGGLVGSDIMMWEMKKAVDVSDDTASKPEIGPIGPLDSSTDEFDLHSWSVKPSDVDDCPVRPDESSMGDSNWADFSENQSEMEQSVMSPTASGLQRTTSGALEGWATFVDTFPAIDKKSTESSSA